MIATPVYGNPRKINITPEEEKSIGKNRLHVFYNSIKASAMHGLGYTLGGVMLTGLYNEAMRLYAENPEQSSWVITGSLAAGGLITAMTLGFQYIIHQAFNSESAEENKAKELKKEYKAAFENKDANLISRLETETPYLEKWGENFIDNYSTAKPLQYKLNFEAKK